MLRKSEAALCVETSARLYVSAYEFNVLIAVAIFRQRELESGELLKTFTNVNVFAGRALGGFEILLLPLTSSSS
jgi:hypothetical protein